jgi:hypothetical protein
MEICPSCGRPFVIATQLLEIVDEGLYHVELLCTNCDATREAVLEDAELEHLERCERAARARIEAALAAFPERLILEVPTRRGER